MNHAVTVYTSGPGCMACTLTKRHLTRRGIQFNEQPINEEIREAAIELDLSTAPIVCTTINGHNQYWDGYRPDRIDALAHQIQAAAS